MRKATNLPGGTKYEILSLLVRAELAADDLAARLAVSGAAIRQHLETLHGMGLVERRKVVSGPNRPTYLYRLSPEGQRAFPKRYDLLLGLVIEALLERRGGEAVAEVVGDAARRLAERVRGRFAAADEATRWALLLDWLEAELAWEAEAAGEAGGERRIVIHHCPFQDVAARHPEVCGVFFGTLLRALYGDASVTHRPERPAACCSLTVGPLPPRAPRA
jgi:DeoR family suf operon transcriptional repressor